MITLSLPERSSFGRSARGVKGGAVDNSAFEPENQDLLPREEALVRLLELAERYTTRGMALQAACSIAARHQLEYGHPLRFGCCADARAAGRPFERGLWPDDERGGDELDVDGARAA